MPNDERTPGPDRAVPPRPPPIYGGIVIAAFGWGLATASPLALVVALGILAFFDVKSRREEAWLRGAVPRLSRLPERDPPAPALGLLTPRATR